MSTSLKVVKIAALFCASFNLFAIVDLRRVILTLSSSPTSIFFLLGEGLKPIRPTRSPFKILPSLPDPEIDSISIFFSSTIRLTAGDNSFFLLTVSIFFEEADSSFLISTILISSFLVSSFFTGALDDGAPTKPSAPPT